MKVLQKKVGEKPEIVDIPNTLEALQETVGGYIETVTEYTAAGAFTVICNEEGRLKGYDYNCEINDVSYVGDICVVGFEGEEFTDLPGETAKIITDYINRGTDRKRGAGMTNGEKHIEKLSDWYKEAVTEGGACYLTCDDKNTLAYALKCCKHFEDIKKDIDSWGLREEISNSEKSNRSEISTGSIIENDCEPAHNKGILECDMYGCKYEPTTKNNLGVDCISKKNALRVANNEYLRGFHNALCKALNETYSIHCDEGHFRVIQEETLVGLGMSMESALGPDAESFMNTLPSVTPQLSVPEVTALAEWIEKLTKASEDAYNKGYADGMKAQEQRKGHWIVQPSNKEQGERDFIWWKCSECGQVIFSETEKDRKEFHSFCGRCGADMREVKE
jgi:hypothetical protein